MAIKPAVDAPDWSEAHARGPAKCRTEPFGGPDTYFEDYSTAMQICNGGWDGKVCPRRTECLRTAMLNRENFGVWGGMTPGDRLRLRNKYPGMPERWTWHPEETAPEAPEEIPQTQELAWQSAA